MVDIEGHSIFDSINPNTSYVRCDYDMRGQKTKTYQGMIELLIVVNSTRDIHCGREYIHIASGDGY